MATEATTEPGVKPLGEYKKLLLRIHLLDDDARAGLFVLMDQIVAMLENEQGCSLTFADLKGDGVLNVLALGNKELVRPLVRAAADFYEGMQHEGPLQ